MSGRRLIGPVDTIWLTMDRPNNLMVIDSVMFFDEPVDWQRLTDVIRERLIARYPVFSQRQVPPLTPISLPHWEDDPEFALERHIHRAKLPGRGDDHALQRYIERQMGVPLDRRHPLWEAHFIDGYGGGGAAVFIRFHHALADGIALARVLLSLSDPTPEGDLIEQTVGRQRKRRQQHDGVPVPVTRYSEPHVTVPVAPRQNGSPIAALTGLPRLAMSTATAAMVQTWRTAGIVNKVLLGSNQPSLLDGKPGVTKRAVWSRPFPLAEIKHVGRLAGATVNDVLVSSVAGAISTYLADRGDIPKDLTTMVPVNVRRLDRPLPRELGNRFALVYLKLPSGLSAPLARLAETKRRMDVIKHSPEPALTFGLIAAIGRTAKEIEYQLVNFFAAKAIGVTTNVAGPTSPRYLAGTKIAGVLAWAPTSGRQTLGVCIFTYNNTVRVGFKVDANTVRNPEKLVHAFDREIETLTRMSHAA